MSRAAIATLSTENLLHNLSVMQQTGKPARVMAMVKANAYGHGLRSVALRLEKQVQSLGVSSIDEAIALREAGVKAPITLIEGVFEPEELLVAAAQNFHVVFHEARQLKWLQARRLPAPLHVWLKVDTGMGRLGFYREEAEKAYKQLSNCENVIPPVHILSHFACADAREHPLNRVQMDDFQSFIHNLPGLKSLANSAGAFQFPEARYDVIRTGIALYGASPCEKISAQEFELKPVMTLQTRLIAVRHMKKGSSIGYGARFVCPEDMPVGVIAIGYGDGYPRSAADGTPIIVNQKRCQIVGRVSMDMATIDLRACPGAKPGDPVVLWGEGLPIEEVATHTCHIAYDLLCGVQSRVKFHWTT
jgi:alanine racemase